MLNFHPSIKWNFQDGWETDENLPLGWFMKPDRSEHSAITALIYILKQFKTEYGSDMFEISSVCQVQG